MGSSNQWQALNTTAIKEFGKQQVAALPLTSIRSFTKKQIASIPWQTLLALETATIELKEGQVPAGISETELSVLETKQKKTQEEYVAAESNAQVAEDNLIKIETDGSDRSSENNYVVLTILGIVGLALVLVGGVLIGFTRWKSFKDAPKRKTPTKEQPAIGVVADT